MVYNKVAFVLGKKFSAIRNSVDFVKIILNYTGCFKYIPEVYAMKNIENLLIFLAETGEYLQCIQNQGYFITL